MPFGEIGFHIPSVIQISTDSVNSYFGECSLEHRIVHGDRPSARFPRLLHWLRHESDDDGIPEHHSAYAAFVLDEFPAGLEFDSVCSEPAFDFPSLHSGILVPCFDAEAFFIFTAMPAALIEQLPDLLLCLRVHGY